MKKKILSALLCVCMVVSVFSLAVSAVDLQAPNGGKSSSTVAGGTEIAADSAETTLEITSIGRVSVPKDTTITAFSNAIEAYFDECITVMNAGTRLKYASLTKYFTITASYTTDLKNVVFSFDPTKDNDLQSSEGAEDKKFKYYVRSNSEVDSNRATAPIDWVVRETLFDVTFGIRKNGDTGKTNNLVATNVATIDAYVLNPDGSEKRKVFVNTIYDLQPGDVIQLNTQLKDEEVNGINYSEIYEFIGWYDGTLNKIAEPSFLKADDGTEVKIESAGTDYEGQPNIRGTWSTKIDVQKSGAVYAVYREKISRFTITTELGEGGKEIVSSPASAAEEKGLQVFTGDNQMSVLAGTNATVSFVPNEGYEVSEVWVDGKQISNFRNLINSLSEKFAASDFDGALKVFGTWSDATNRDVYSYTFEKVDANHTIKVNFAKTTVYTPAEGIKDPVTGPELSTGEVIADAPQPEAGAPTTLPAEQAGDVAAAGVINPQTGSTSAIAVFATLSIAAAAAFITAKRKHN